jgi:chromosomal replication initiator protein
MMINNIWQDFLSIVQQEVGSQMVETWLKAVVLQQWDAREKVVYLKVPNSFVKEWLKTHYTTLFERHLGRLFNVDTLKVVLLQTDEEIVAVDASRKTQKLTVYTPAVAEVASSSAAMVSKPSGRAAHTGNSNYRFDTFVVGASNQLAYAAASAVAEKPGKIYNPLFMYGGSGLGKTHLLHAIGNHIKNSNKRAAVLYQTADRFVNEFINAIRFDKVHHFQAKYKDIDVLLIDDVQFISNKEQTQEAFFHIFNSLYDAHKQIVFSSDAYPQNINGLAERLRSRLEWGLVTDIQMPSLETKIAILKKKADLHNVHLDDEVAHFLAARFSSNIRALEGSLIHVMAVASLTKQLLTLELAKKVVVRHIPEQRAAVIDFDCIVKCISDHYTVPLQDLRSGKRGKEVSYTRQIAMYFMKKMTTRSLQDIGLFLGRKDHSTVIHALNKIQEMLKKDQAMVAQLIALEEKIKRASR